MAGPAFMGADTRTCRARMFAPVGQSVDLVRGENIEVWGGGVLLGDLS